MTLPSRKIANISHIHHAAVESVNRMRTVLNFNTYECFSPTRCFRLYIQFLWIENSLLVFGVHSIPPSVIRLKIPHWGRGTT